MHTSISLLPCLCLALFILFLLGLSYAPKPDLRTKRQCLQALSSVLVPIASRWPVAYVPSASDTRKRRKRIPVFALLADITNNAVELRNPQEDLPLLMKGQLCVYGWKIILSFGLLDALYIAWSLLRRYLISFSSPSAPQRHNYFMTGAIPHTFNAHRGIRPDLIPRQQMFGMAQGAASHKRDYIDTYEITTLQSGISLFSRDFLLAAVPFLRARLVQLNCSTNSPTLFPTLHKSIAQISGFATVSYPDTLPCLRGNSGGN